MDQLYPEKQFMKNRYKRLKTLTDTAFETQFQNITQPANLPVAPAKVIHRRDTVEKNLDEMFSSDTETELEMKEIKPEMLQNGNDENCRRIPDTNIPKSPTNEPFYGFQEDETCAKLPSKDTNTEICSNKVNLPILSNIPKLSSSLLQIDSNGNTFGMSSVLASPISDFNSDYESDEIHESTLMDLRNTDVHNK